MDTRRIGSWQTYQQTMAVQYDATYTSGGWYEIRERDATGRWIATDEPVDIVR